MKKKFFLEAINLACMDLIEVQHLRFEIWLTKMHGVEENQLPITSKFSVAFLMPCFRKEEEEAWRKSKRVSLSMLVKYLRLINSLIHKWGRLISSDVIFMVKRTLCTRYTIVFFNRIWQWSQKKWLKCLKMQRIHLQ